MGTAKSGPHGFVLLTAVARYNGDVIFVDRLAGFGFPQGDFYRAG
jgi:hypothetical protein